MWQKSLLDTMFPDGVIPGSQIRVEDFENASTEMIGTTEHKMARNMICEAYDIIWYPDGHVERKCTYDVYPFMPVNGVHVLSYFGGKMVQNWLQFTEGQRAEEKEKEIQDAGFNYTGL